MASRLPMSKSSAPAGRPLQHQNQLAWSNEDQAAIGIITETAPAGDTASSGLNGRLQRIAQRISSLIGLFPNALGASGGIKVEIVAGAGSGGTAIADGGYIYRGHYAGHAVGRFLPDHGHSQSIKLPASSAGRR